MANAGNDLSRNLLASKFIDVLQAFDSACCELREYIFGYYLEYLIEKEDTQYLDATKVALARKCFLAVIAQLRFIKVYLRSPLIVEGYRGGVLTGINKCFRQRSLMRHVMKIYCEGFENWEGFETFCSAEYARPKIWDGIRDEMQGADED